jgi:phage tail-like protein
LSPAQAGPNKPLHRRAAGANLARQPWEETLAANTQDFPVNPQRLTPFPNFRFKLAWTGAGDTLRYVAGLSHVGGLARHTEVMRHREGGDPSTPHLAPGQTKYGPITLERGVSYDPAFEQWANKIFDLKNSQGQTGQNTSLGDFRKDLTLELYNEAGQKVLAYRIYRAWVSDFSALSELDAMGNALVIESMILQNEGWQRDAAVSEPREPSFTEPGSDG